MNGQSRAKTYQERAARNPIFLNIRSNFEAAERQLLQELNNLRLAQHSLWHNSVESRVACKLKNISVFDVKIWFLVFVLMVADQGLLIFCVVFLIFLAYVAEPLLEANFERRNRLVLADIRCKVALCNSSLGGIRNEFASKWDEACSTFVGYPPDWIERRKRVLDRDRNICTNCGARPENGKLELHAHHIIAISNGGNNMMSNLVTLCHFCHKNVDLEHQETRPSWEFDNTNSVRRRRKVKPRSVE